MFRKKLWVMAAFSAALSGAVAAQPVPQLTLHDGLTVPQLGCGVWELDGREAYASVSAAIKLGYRLIDTAQYYQNEAETYQAVLDSGIPRSEFFITSKLNPHYSSEQEIRKALDLSLQNMGGTIDLMLIHWPFGADELAWKIMEEYVRAGKFKAIGLSNYHPDALRRMLKIATIKPQVNQIEFHPYNSKLDELVQNQELGVTVEAWSPLGAGRQKVMADPVIERIAKAHGKSTAQIILRWDIQHGVITIPRSRNPRHLQENIEVGDFELSEQEMRDIDALNKNAALWDI